MPQKPRKPLVGHDDKVLHVGDLVALHSDASNGRTRGVVVELGRRLVHIVLDGTGARVRTSPANVSQF